MLSRLNMALRALLRRPQAERELDEELRHHIEQQTEQNIRLGMSPEEARYTARKAFGGVEQAKERSRDTRGLRWIEEFWQDLRYGARMLLKSPGFTLVAVITLALGVGANTAIFSIVNAVLLRPLPYKDPDRLAMLWTDDPQRGIHEEGTSFPNFEDWRAQSRLFADMAICTRGNDANLTGGDESERVLGERVSANLFPLLGVAPALGRTISPEDEQRRERVVVLSHNLWQRRFGADPHIIGKTLEIGGRSSQVVGVMPANFYFPSKETQLWESVSLVVGWDRQKTQRYSDWWRVIGRLKPG